MIGDCAQSKCTHISSDCHHRAENDGVDDKETRALIKPYLWYIHYLHRDFTKSDVQKTIKEVFGVEIPVSTINRWKSELQLVNPSEAAKHISLYQKMVLIMDGRLSGVNSFTFCDPDCNHNPTLQRNQLCGRNRIIGGKELQDCVSSDRFVEIPLLEIKTIERALRIELDLSCQLHERWVFTTARSKEGAIVYCLSEGKTGAILSMPVFSTPPSPLALLYCALTAIKDTQGYPSSVQAEGISDNLLVPLREFLVHFHEGHDAASQSLFRLLDETDWAVQPVADSAGKHPLIEYLNEWDGEIDLPEYSNQDTDKLRRLLGIWVWARSFSDLYNLQPTILHHRERAITPELQSVIQRECWLTCYSEHGLQSQLTHICPIVIEGILGRLRDRYWSHLGDALLNCDALSVCSRPEVSEGEHTVNDTPRCYH